MLQAFAPVDVVRVVELVGIVGIGYLGLRIQNAVGQIRLEQARVKEDLVKGQTDLRQDFETKHAENSQAIAVHSAADEAKFDAIKDGLALINVKLDRMSNNGRISR